MTDGDVPPARKPSLKARLSALFNEYGRIAIYTYFTLSILTIIGCSIGFAIGVAPTTATGVLGVIGAGWVAAKASLPIRIPITLAITPGVAWVVRRFWPPDPDDEDDDGDEDDHDAAASSPSG